MTTTLSLVLVLELAACGTDTGAAYTEQHDTTNNSNVGGTPEATGLTLVPGGSIAIDGTVDAGHYDSEDLDYDAYTFTVGADVTGTMTLTGSDANAALQTFKVGLIDATSFGVGHARVGAPATVHLPAGVYKLEVQAQNPAPITASYPYTVEVAAP